MCDIISKKGAILIQGPKWCGKTTTAEMLSKSILYMAKPEDKTPKLTDFDESNKMVNSADNVILLKRSVQENVELILAK